MIDLPEKFKLRLQEILPEAKASAIFDTFSIRKKIGFRINTLISDEKNVHSELENIGIEYHRFSALNNAFYTDSTFKSQLTTSNCFTLGNVYIQNISSMLPVMLLDPHPDDRVLDIAAAPGSKTTQMAISMENHGWISAVEINKARFFKLKSNLKLAGIENVHTYLMDGANVWKKCPEQFDKILVDAPCSSESRINIHEPNSYAYWSEKKIQQMCKKQRRLLFSAINSLKPGGELLYSTCSFAPEENEGAISSIMDKYSDALEIQAINLPIENLQTGLTHWRKKSFCENIELSKRVLPTEIMDGFYICKIRKIKSTLQ